MKVDLHERVTFESRHLGKPTSDTEVMLSTIGVKSLDQLISETVPETIRLKKPLQLPQPLNEFQFISAFREIVQKNQIYKSFIGLGYYHCVVPAVIQRNILENPGWYTAYTPYQAEIAQGRLEALINYQTLITDLTGMSLANASLLDEGTAAAEAMAMLFAAKPASKKNATVFAVDHHVFPQVLSVLLTRSEPLGIVIEICELEKLDISRTDVFGTYFQYPDSQGNIKDRKAWIETAKEHDIAIAVGADLMSLVLLTPPGEMGVDVVVGSSQRFGVPMGFGGPHAAFFATKDVYKRLIPGRIIGLSVDANGNPAYRMALQTREQHIKREKATSNICTSQVLLSVMASMYAVYHGPNGLKVIARRIHGLACLMDELLQGMGYLQANKNYFDTLKIDIESTLIYNEIKKNAEAHRMNLRFDNASIYISFDESHSPQDVYTLTEIFAKAMHLNEEIWIQKAVNQSQEIELKIEAKFWRTSEFMTHDVFHKYHTEHEILRYIKRLESKDLSLVHSMISLGSCTMKLNATTEMVPLSWPEINQIHPFAPEWQTEGYQHIFKDLTQWLAEITGFHAISLQPNSGAQGEYAGLMVIRAYHKDRGDIHRNIALIPSSAHGTNPASAVMAGMKVVIVLCDSNGNVDIEDLKQKAKDHEQNLAALMVTYPSTHGVFEEKIKEICNVIHKHGGLVYMDGANMNAQVGLTSPAEIGADVCHLNLHKTFCIPHGGGGPGVGPIGVTEALSPYLPGNPIKTTGGEKAITAISSAPWGSASILTISYAYIAMMGGESLKKATETAILNANYIKCRLENHYKILYSGSKGRCAHEMIVDCREFKTFGIEVEDIAKRLMDYGYHAPTISFPVPGTMMIEPTESESKSELDKFCDTLISIRREIDEVKSGKYDKDNNVLKNAPHTAVVIMADKWNKPYSRAKAAFPLPFLKENKFWPAVGRIDNAYGDRNLFCTCAPIQEYVDIQNEVAVV